MSSEIQSILIPKQHYTKKQAIQWIKKNNFKTKFRNKSVDETDLFYHFRQRDPGRYESIKTIKKGNITFRIGVFNV
jgi:hypothetical protein